MVQPISQSGGSDTRERQPAALGRRIGVIFWLKWVFANVVGYAAGLMLGGAFEQWVFPHLVFQADLITGAVVGVLQGLVLRWRVSRVVLWVLANVVGLTVFSYAGDAVGDAIYRLVDAHLGYWAPWASKGLVMGVAIGILQGLVLRWRVFRVGVWVLANVVGYAAGWVAGFQAFGDALGGVFGSWGMVVVYAVGGAAVGIVTGIALVWLLRYPDPTAVPDG